MNMTEKQWGALFVALGQVPVVDVAMNLDHRETLILQELALKGADAAQRGFLHYGDGDKLDAVDLAQRLSIDPATAKPKPARSEEQMRADMAQDWLYDFLDAVDRAGTGV